MPKTSKKLFQWNYIVDGLIPKEVKLRRKIWLKKNKLLLEQRGEKLYAFLLGDENQWDPEHTAIQPYIWISSLITNNTAVVSGGGGSSIKSPKDLGSGRILKAEFSISNPEEAAKDIEPHVEKFLNFIGRLHDRYIDIVENNRFMQIAFEYFYDSQDKFVYTDDGLISAMISLEALFNDGGGDIKYKLAQRASLILGLNGFDPHEVFDNVKAFYDIRSNLVHGSGSKKSNVERYNVSNYTRRALTSFLILLSEDGRRKSQSKNTKQNLIKEIDRAILDIEKRKLLEKEIKSGMKYFKLPVPRVFEGVGKKGKYRTTAW